MLRVKGQLAAAMTENRESDEVRDERPYSTDVGPAQLWHIRQKTQPSKGKLNLKKGYYSSRGLKQELGNILR